jgi:hypothetical protein
VNSIGFATTVVSVFDFWGTLGRPGGRSHVNYPADPGSEMCYQSSAGDAEVFRFGERLKGKTRSLSRPFGRADLVRPRNLPGVSCVQFSVM